MIQALHGSLPYVRGLPPLVFYRQPYAFPRASVEHTQAAGGAGALAVVGLEVDQDTALEDLFKELLKLCDVKNQTAKAPKLCIMCTLPRHDTIDIVAGPQAREQVATGVSVRQQTACPGLHRHDTLLTAEDASRATGVGQLRC